MQLRFRKVLKQPLIQDQKTEVSINKNIHPARRLAERKVSSRTLVNEFFDWTLRLNALPNTLLGKAEHYAKSQRKYLERYLMDGRLEISNNRAERGVKPFVIGRKNWVFSNTPNGASAFSA